MQRSWETIINSNSRGAGIIELRKYKDLILLLVKRDFVSLYKQTILGPIWVILQPIIMTITYIVVFNRIANIDTGVPPILFYLLGICLWTYFADCVLKTSETFIANQSIFGKVYFPRLVVPFSIVLTNLIKLGIQFLLFIFVYVYYLVFIEIDFHFSWQIVLLPVVLITMIFLGMGVGLIIASLTTKYRDLRFLIQFGIQLLMFASPVVYPLNSIGEDYQWIVSLNPMTNAIETFKAGFFGDSFAVFNWWFFGYGIISSCTLFFIGLFFFKRVERNFMDSI